VKLQGTTETPLVATEAADDRVGGPRNYPTTPGGVRTPLEPPSAQRDEKKTLPINEFLI
jgi:hypothetical protein